ncbi:Signal Peptide Peptidase-Like 2C [Manis pentadactyla]|nr:Signal Peptide Peptidase-Like 2C [Manis pentadactyla]
MSTFVTLGQVHVGDNEAGMGDFTTTSYHLEVTTETSKIQMRDGLERSPPDMPLGSRNIEGSAESQPSSEISQLKSFSGSGNSFPQKRNDKEEGDSDEKRQKKEKE